MMAALACVGGVLLFLSIGVLLMLYSVDELRVWLLRRLGLE